VSEDRLFRTDAVVIKRADSGEADRLLTLYTPHMGKIRAVAKGARKTTSRLGGHVELFTLTRLMIAKGRNLDYVTQAETVRSFIEIRDDLDLVIVASYVAELVDQFTENRIENQALYALLLSTFQNLPQAADTDLLLRHFELHLLSLIGYQPELHHCLSCRRELEPVTNAFSAAAGGVLCPQCAGSQMVRREVSVEMVKCLRFLQSNDYPQASRLRLRPELHWELETVLGETLRYLLERELRSAAFLHTLRGGRRQLAGGRPVSRQPVA